MKNINIISAGDEVPTSFEDNKRIIKVNLPDSEENFISGNGEGVWAFIRNEDDMEKYDNGEGSFEVILLNHSMYYYNILSWGNVILVDGRGASDRPVMNKEWIEQILSE